MFPRGTHLITCPLIKQIHLLLSQVLEISHNYSASLTFSLDYKTENSAGCRPFLGITQHQGIIYMSNSEAISTCLNNEVIEYQITVTQFARNRTSTLKVKLGAGVNNMSSFNSSGLFRLENRLTMYLTLNDVICL